MKLPNLGDLSTDEQRPVLYAPADEDLFVVGPPGSGKTTLAVLRAQWLVGQGIKVTVVTRNHLLRKLVLELGAASADTMNHAVSDHYHGVAHRYIPQHAPFDYVWDTALADLRAANAPPVADHLIVDEGQNLPPGFFAWAREFGGRTLTVFADEEQSTSDQCSTLQQIAVRAGLPMTPRRLTHNYRNTPEIAKVAEHFHRSRLLPPALVQQASVGETPRLVAVNSWDQLADLVAQRYRNRRESIAVIVCTKADARALATRVGQRLPAAKVEFYTSNDGNAHMLELLKDGVTVLCQESAIGLEFETVYLVDLGRKLPCTTDAACRWMYMLCARARRMLLLIDGTPSALTPDKLAALPPHPILER